MNYPEEISHRKERKYKRQRFWHCFINTMKHYLMFKEMSVTAHAQVTLEATYTDDPEGLIEINPRVRLVHIGCSCGWYTHGNEELYQYWVDDTTEGTDATLNEIELPDDLFKEKEDSTVDKNEVK